MDNYKTKTDVDRKEKQKKEREMEEARRNKMIEDELKRKEMERDRSERGEMEKALQEHSKEGSCSSRDSSASRGKDADESDGEEMDPCDGIMEMVTAFDTWFRQPADNKKRLTKGFTLKVSELMEKIRVQVVREKCEKAYLKGRLDERKDIQNLIREEMKEKESGPTQPNYAEVVGRATIPKVSGMIGNVVRPSKVVIIKGKGKESEEVKKRVMGVNIRWITKIRNGIRVEVEDERSLDKIEKSEELRQAGMEVEKPKKKKPTLMVYDVPATLTDRDFVKEITARNVPGGEVDTGEALEDIKVTHKFPERGRGDERRRDILIETTMKMRNLLRKRDRLFIEWSCCRVKDYIDVERRYECQGFGHVAKFCRREDVCGNCMRAHPTNTCKARKGEEECTNCKREGWVDSKHPAWWKECPVFIRQRKRYMDNIGYGDDD